MTRRLILAILLSLPLVGYAQVTKALKQARKMVYTVQTYDAEGKVLQRGNGFFASPDGNFIT